MPQKYQLKVVGNVVYWLCGNKWLIKETCVSPEAALALLEELNS